MFEAEGSDEERLEAVDAGELLLRGVEVSSSSLASSSEKPINNKTTVP